MEHRQLGSSDIEVSAVIFGAWAIGGWMWGGTDHDASVAAIRAGIEAGSTSIDTAPAYGMGLSEQIVGEAVSAFPRDSVQVLTKYGQWHW